LLRTIGQRFGPEIRVVAWSPDGKILAASGEGDGAVRLWDAQTGDARGVLRGHNASLIALAWSPDGKMLASGGWDKTVRVWDARDARTLQVLEGQGDIQGLTWSPDSAKLAAANNEGRGVRVWQAATGKPLHTLKGQEAPTSCVVWSPDGKRLASASWGDDPIRFWDADTGRPLKTLELPFTSTLSWSPDGKTLAVGHWGGKISLRDPDTGSELKTLQRQTSALNQLTWSPDSNTLASCCLDRVIRLWNAGTGQALAVLLPLRHGQGVALSPDGHYRGTPQVERLLRYVVQTDDRQETLAAEEFEKRYGWHNDPERVGLVGPPVKAKPAGVVIAPEPMAAPEGATLLFEDTFDDDPKKGRPRTAGDARHSVGEKDGKHFIELRKDFPPEEPVSSYFGEAAHDFVCDMRLRYSGGRCLLWVRSFEGDPRIQLMLAFGPDGKVYVLREYVRGKKQEKTELLAKHEPGTPLFQQNQWLDLRLVARGEEVELSVNGRLIVQFTDPLRPSEARKPAKPAIRAGIIRASNTAARLELDHIRIWRIDPKKSQVSPGSSLSPLALVQEPTPLQGVRSWTVETVSHREHVRALAYRPDGRLLASASRDGTIRLWEPETGRLARILVGHQGPAQSDQNAVAVAWSPDGRYLATAGMDNAVQLWEAGTGRPLRTLKGHTQPVCAVAWSDDGRTLASGGRDGTIRLWDPASVQPLDTLQGEKGLIFALAWAPKSKLLAAATIQKAVQLWDTETSRLVRTFPSKEEADAVAWAPDGTMLAYADWKDHSVQCWDMATGRLRHTLRHEGNVHAVAWSPDGARLVSAGNGCVCIWDARSGQLLRTIRTVVWRMAAVAWAPDGKAIVSGGDDGAVRVWNPDTGEMLRSLPAAGLHTNGLYDIAWSPDGSMLASASSWAEATVRLWDSRTGQLLHTLEGHKGEGVRRVAWAPDSKFVASAGGDDRTVRVWDAQTGRALAVLEGHTHWVHSVAWSPDGKTLASGGEDHTVRLWDVPSGKCLHILEGHTGLVNDVAWSPDGQKLASTDAEGRAVRVWQAGTGKLLQTLGGQNGNAWRVAWLRDSKTLLSLWGYDRKVRVWNAETGKEIRIIPDTGATAFALALDQRSLAVGDWEGGLVVWDRRAAKPGTILKGHTGELRGLAWSPDGKRLASACEDGQIRLWDATSGRTLAVLLTLPHGQGVAIGPGGHYRGTPQVERLLRYVVQTDEGQETLTTEEFEKRFGWHNDPGQVRLSGS
jgi:WD40 repeat protein